MDLIIDVNGYYAGAGTPNTFSTNTFLGFQAGNSTMQGTGNTAMGASALKRNGPGNDNAAIGFDALSSNMSGSSNTASGNNALRSNTFGSNNTALGRAALLNNTYGNQNTAVGYDALSANTWGNANVAIGPQAGSNLTTGNNNLCIWNAGAAGESDTIRIGQVQTRAFIAGIRGVATGMLDAIPVLIDSAGQLGTTSSSARVKEQIRDMGEASSALQKLRPVTFHYKGQSQGSNPLHFGLIAEEVDEVLPELVVHRPTGEAETVLYHEMPAMLLNELQKQQRLIRALEARVAELEAALRGQAERQ